MLATILFFTEFGHATKTSGELLAIKELPHNALSGNNLPTFIIEYRNHTGKRVSIETRSEFYVYQGNHHVLGNREWSCFNKGDMLKLNRQLPASKRVFLRNEWNVIASYLLEGVNVNLQPAPAKIDVNKSPIYKKLKAALTSA